MEAASEAAFQSDCRMFLQVDPEPGVVGEPAEVAAAEDNLYTTCSALMHLSPLLG